MTTLIKTPYAISLEKHRFHGNAPGAHLVAGARIHGDEPSGETAERRIIREILEGKIRIVRGQLTLLPVLNPLAKEENVRGIWRDGNRSIVAGQQGLLPEDAIARSITRIFRRIDQISKKAGYPWHYLDFHSVPLQGQAHTILSEGPLDLAFAKAAGVPHIYTGWRDAQLNVSDADLKALGTTREEHTKFTSALIYAARDFGAGSAVCLESGQNDDPESVETAYRALRNALAFHGLTDEAELPFPVPRVFSLTRFHQVIYRHDESEKLIGIDHDAQPVEPGQVILQGLFRKVSVPQEPGPWIIAHPIPEADVGRHIGFIAHLENDEI